MRINNTNQTSFGMKDIRIMAPLGSRQYRSLKKLVDNVRPRLMEIGDKYTDLLVWREGPVKFGVCAVAGREHLHTYDTKIISGKAEDWFIRNRENGLCELTQRALFRINAVDKLEDMGYEIKNGVSPEQANLAFTLGVDTLSQLLRFEHYSKIYQELRARGIIGFLPNNN